MSNRVDLDTRLIVRIDTDLLRRCEAEAAKLRLSLSAWVRTTLIGALGAPKAGPSEAQARIREAREARALARIAQEADDASLAAPPGMDWIKSPRDAPHIHWRRGDLINARHNSIVYFRPTGSTEQWDFMTADVARGRMVR